MPMKALRGGVGERGDDPDHLPGAVQQRPAGVAGVDRRVELDEIAQGPAAFLHRAVEPGDDAGGNRVGEPEWVPDGVRLVTDLDTAAEHGRHDHLREALRHEHCGVVVRIGLNDVGPASGAVHEGDRILAAPSTTWNAVMMVPFALTTTPVPNPSPRPSAWHSPSRSRRSTAGSAGTRPPRSQAWPEILDRVVDDPRGDRPRLRPVERPGRVSGRKHDHARPDGGHDDSRERDQAAPPTPPLLPGGSCAAAAAGELPRLAHATTLLGEERASIPPDGRPAAPKAWRRPLVRRAAARIEKPQRMQGFSVAGPVSRILRRDRGFGLNHAACVPGVRGHGREVLPS